MIHLKRNQTCNRLGSFSLHTDGVKKWIIPAWIEVPLETQFSDIVVEAEAEPPRAEVAPPDKAWTFIGSKGNEYEVKRDGGSFTCTCPASLFQRNKLCKHIKEAMGYDK